MDANQRQIAALQQDPEIAARIVRNIANIERDFYLASGPLSQRLIQEAHLLMSKVAIEPWRVVASDLSVRVMSPDWKQTHGVGHGDAWLELSDITSDEVEDCTWIATAVRAGPTQMCLELMFRKGLFDFATSAIGNDKAIASLFKLGFVRDDTGTRLYLPIDIPAELLAQGFEQNDLDEALASVSKSLGLAFAAKAELDALVQSIRDAAKRK